MVRIGTAGWSIPKQNRDAFLPEGTHLVRYAARFSCVEINSSFYRPHRPSTYARWAASVPQHFRFSLKVPKEITHKRKLIDCNDFLSAFLSESAMLGETLGPYVVQLAPSHAFDEAAAETFFEHFRNTYSGTVAIEPRNESWFGASSVALLRRYRITRIGADPAHFPGADISEAFGGFAYYRWHGSPRTYYSAYDEERLRDFARTADAYDAGDTWCIFDNTALGAATENALWFVRANERACPR